MIILCLSCFITTVNFDLLFKHILSDEHILLVKNNTQKKSCFQGRFLSQQTVPFVKCIQKSFSYDFFYRRRLDYYGFCFSTSTSMGNQGIVQKPRNWSSTGKLHFLKFQVLTSKKYVKTYIYQTPSLFGFQSRLFRLKKDEFHVRKFMTFEINFLAQRKYYFRLINQGTG